MKFEQLVTEQEASPVELRPIKITDTQGLQQFADFYNDAGTLTWTLTPNRLKKKLGTRGRLWGLFVEGTDQMVGSIGLKSIKDDGEGQSLGEMGYLMLDKAYSNLPNVLILYKAALKKVRTFDAVFMTTNIRNRAINKLLDRSSKAELALMVKSPYGNNKLYVWQVGRKTESRAIIDAHFADSILKEF